MRSRISRSLWQGLSFRCYRSDRNQSDFAFFTAPLRIFFIYKQGVCTGSGVSSRLSSRGRHPPKIHSAMTSALSAAVLIPYSALIEVFFTTTSCAPPSRIEAGLTKVIFAFCCNSGIERAPQLHIVCTILLVVICTLS